MKLRFNIWPGVVVSMLAANVAIVAFTVIAARRGEGALVAPSYDERALKWSDHQRDMAASSALGWKCKVQVARAAAMMADGTLRVTLTDRTGAPLAGVALSAICFHSGHPDKPARCSLTTDETGKASSPVATIYPGLYTVLIESPAISERAAFQFETETDSDASQY